MKSLKSKISIIILLTAGSILPEPNSSLGEVEIGRQWLVVIGINRYQEWLPLRGPVKDAQSIRDILLRRYRFDETIEIYNQQATKTNILQLLKDLAKRVKEHDSVLIFYAGHGHYDEPSNSGFWIPADGGTDLDLQKNWLPNTQIAGHIKKLRSRHVLIITDACFAGDILQLERSAQPKITNEYFRRAYNNVSRQALTSGALETVPDDSSFAQQLRMELEANSNPYIDPLLLYGRIRSGVHGSLPLFGSISNAGHETGGSFLLFLKEKELQQSYTTQTTLTKTGDQPLLNFDRPQEPAAGQTIAASLFAVAGAGALFAYNTNSRALNRQNAEYRDSPLPLLLGTDIAGLTLRHLWFLEQHRRLDDLQQKTDQSLAAFVLLWSISLGATALQFEPTNESLRIKLETHF